MKRKKTTLGKAKADTKFGRELIASAREAVALKKGKLTDAERHKRFKAMAKEVGASEDPKDFERAFKAVAPLKAGGKEPS